MSTHSSTQARGRHGCGPRACLLGLLVVLALGYLLLRGAGAFLITGDRLEKADVVVPLGGGGESRVIEAARLIQVKTATWMLLTEPGGDPPGSQFSRQVAVENGLSPAAILVTEGVQSSTHDEAEAVLAFLKKHQFSSVIIVTDPFHTQRTRLIFRDVFQGSGLEARVHPVPDHWYRSSTWFLSAEGWWNTLREYGKLLGYLTGISKSLD